MLVLLPPSETKRDGGEDGSVYHPAALSFPSLAAPRRAVLASLAELSRDPDAAAAALKIGPSLRFELERNRRVRKNPVMPAMDRYTGVVYDALDAASLDPSARAFLADNVVIASALFGLVGAGDPIPAYRLSHNSRLPGLKLTPHWRDAVARVIAAHDGLVVDARSEAYVGLGPAPLSDRSVFLRVVTEGPDGTRRALNHFNKKGKGEFVRSLARAGIVHECVDSLITWADGAGIRLVRGDPGELVLVV